MRGDIDSGFTLLEVLLASGILAVGLAAILTLYSSSLNGLSLAGKYEEAHFTAESVMARMLFADKTAPFSLSGKSGQPPGAVWEARGEAGDISGVNVLTVSVRFKHAGKMRSVDLETSQIAQGQ